MKDKKPKVFPESGIKLKKATFFSILVIATKWIVGMNIITPKPALKFNALYQCGVCL